MVTLIAPVRSRGDIIFYDPDVDISVGLFNYFINADDITPDIKPGIYVGAYLSLKSPFFSDFFNTERLYSIFEAGVALSDIENESASFITIPLHVDLAYRMRIRPKLHLLPFIGTGLHITYNEFLDNPAYSENFKDRPFVSPIIGTGFELRWGAYKNTTIKLVKLNYGLIFDGRVQSGYVQYLQLRFPIPFIP
jgi:hypothetical protein